MDVVEKEEQSRLFGKGVKEVSNVACDYAKIRAIIGIIGSFIACLFLMFFGITTLLSKTPEPSPVTTGDEESSKKNKPAPKWLSVVFIILGPLIVGGSFLYYYMLRKYPTLCTVAGVYDAAKSVKTMFSKQ